MDLPKSSSLLTPRSLAIDLKQLRYVVQIADSGSVSKAAEILRVAQPSLSLQLKTVEEELGVQLLARHSRGVRLTEDGKIFVEYARRILDEMDQIPQVLRSTASNPVGRVRVGLPMSACRGLAMPLIKAAAKRYPRIKLHVVEAMTGYLEEWIQSGKLDVALLYDHKASENVAWTEMITESLNVICAAHSSFAELDGIEFTSLRKMPLVLPGRPNTLRNVLERFSSKLDLDIKVSIDCDSLMGIIQLVGGGYVTVLPSFAVKNEIRARELIAVPLTKPTPSWTLSVVLSKSAANVHSGRAVADLVADTIRTMVDCGEWDARLTSRCLVPAYNGAD